MSEIYKRSMGMTYDERALRLELAGGVSGYTETVEEPVYEGASDLMLEPVADGVDALRNERSQWLMIEAVNGELTAEERAEVVLLEAEIVFREYEERMQEVATEHPKYTWHVGQILSRRLDALKAQGAPVDPEMYIEAEALAEEIVSANPDMNAGELSQVVVTMVEMIQAEYKLRQLTLVA